MNLSLVIPLYNEDESLSELIEWIARVVQKMSISYEVIFVDDGSKDKSWSVIQDLSAKYPEVRGIKFQRNYGKSAALHEGFRKAKGDVVITMDADLQDSPDEIPELYRMIADEKLDLVSGWKQKRHDPLSKTIPTKLYNWAARKMSGVYLHDFNCGLKAYNSKVVKSIEVYGEMHRYIPIMAKRAGFVKIKEKVVQHQARKYGVTKFGIERFLFGFLDLMSITFVSRFSKSPMHFFGTLGFFMSILGLIIAAFIGYQKWAVLQVGQQAPLVVNNPFFYMALTLMILGSQMFLAGFLGELISRSSSDRNKYQIEDEI
ncbi:MAG: glycosyltransferase family 2 protein [Chitinophagales bacterium]